MQQHQPNLFPVPDVGRVPSARSRFPARPSSSPSAPNFIIVGLFALRLAKRLLEGLEYYPGRDADIIWLVNFLAPFSDDYPLAKISGRQKDDYLQMYPALVSRMKKQPRYPIRFMQMNPDQSMYQSRQCGVAEQPKKMTDVKRLETIDFCDAANEWGSSVPIPASEDDNCTTRHRSSFVYRRLIGCFSNYHTGPGLMLINASSPITSAGLHASLAYLISFDAEPRHPIMELSLFFFPFHIQPPALSVPRFRALAYLSTASREPS
ncbi:hypothetical protein BM1_07277 [Bipolaris maydis]|nr:hypothetical protein BM1_07277 [Bipolaris maydis]